MTTLLVVDVLHGPVTVDGAPASVLDLVAAAPVTIEAIPPASFVPALALDTPTVSVEAFPMAPAVEVLFTAPLAIDLVPLAVIAVPSGGGGGHSYFPSGW